MRRAEPFAGLGGALLLVALFLTWYGGDALPPVSGDLQPYGPPDQTAWQAFTMTDVLLAILAVPAILVPVLSVATRGPAKAIAIAVIASATGWLAIVLVAFRLVLEPEGMRPLSGAWLALAGALLAWVGSWLSLRDESTPGAVAPDIPRRPVPG
jgi:hypothetical protein